ncbi:hypothetical protein ACVIW2_003016 [Bradyrhizobium huanghuaihaiense]|uniref:Uncharacterized protein n=1 Tax=Bradyrhizobium huanghuaihaiense TaxID=990078 RepID=A0A562S225_9BRAD|nr:hypothetical protein IQ16_01041 [Bradyrhizobium huanghuaihaiense]
MRVASQAVVPAKAGTHNHREWFGEDWSFGIVIARYREITRYGSRPPCAIAH